MASTPAGMARLPTALDLIRRGAVQHADRIALVCGDAQMTFREVDHLSSQLAHALRSHGVVQGQRMALLLNNSLYTVPLDFACVKAGVSRVPLNARLSEAEHARMLQDTGCAVLVFGADLRERAQALQAQVAGLSCLGIGASVAHEGDLLERAAQQPVTGPDNEVQPDDVMMALFTSGTTGTLKAAQHTQASYAGICRNVLLNLMPIGPDDAMLHAASLIHASGVFVLPFWLRGARTVIMPAFDPTAYLRLLTQERITTINLVPTMLQMLLAHPDFESTDVSHLKAVIYGASPMPRPVIERAMAAWGQHRFWQYFGQTEVPLCLAVLRPEHHVGDLLGAAGYPCLDVELRIVDEAGQPVASGEVGEVMVRSSSAVSGYLNAPELTAETFDTEGWVHTRDMGLIDERGFLHLRDRKSDMIITGGYNVYPLEVENALMTHPAVRECVVVGLPHEKWIEMVTAVVALQPGQHVAGDALIAHVAAQVAGYKKPGRVVFVDEVPKTAVGKLNRRAMREQLTAADAGQGQAACTSRDYETNSTPALEPSAQAAIV